MVDHQGLFTDYHVVGWRVVSSRLDLHNVTSVWGRDEGPVTKGDGVVVRCTVRAPEEDGPGRCVGDVVVVSPKGFLLVSRPVEGGQTVSPLN